MQITTRTFLFFLAGVVAFLIHGHADYLLQAYQHGWDTWWDLHGRAAAWPWYLDFLPRDAWHAVQMVRNQSVMLGTIFMVISMRRVGWELNSQSIPPRWFYRLVWVSPFVCYGITRAVAFSLVKEILN